MANIVPTGARGVEIGVFRGQFSRELVELLAPEKLYLIDPWRNFKDPALTSSWYHADSKFDMNAMYRAVCHRFDAEIQSGQVEILRGITKNVVSGIADDTLDFAYIDGDHRFEGVMTDLDLISPKVKDGGVIFLDDHNVGHWWGDGVVRALNTFLGKAPAHWQLIRVAGNQAVIRKRQPDDS